MRTDDISVGRLLTRREALALLGASGAALFGGAFRTSTAAGAPPGCVVRPVQTEGPFFVDGELERSDIRSDARGDNVREGIPLKLKFNVARISDASCTALAGAQVHVWHADASGRYSDVGARNASGTSLQFLRGYQRTDAMGTAQFMTIFPGWYGGRTAHIHFKIRLAAPSGSAARTQEFTSQLYFDDALQDRVFATAPYIPRGTQDTHNTDDFLYRSGGRQLLLELQPDGPGYATVFDIGVQI